MICNKCHGQTFELNGIEICPECERWKIRFEYNRVLNERARKNEEESRFGSNDLVLDCDNNFNFRSA